VGSEQADGPYQIMKIHPPVLESGKLTEGLLQGENLSAMVGVYAHEGEVVYHAHSGEDAIWLVLGGEATFYREAERVIAVLAPYEAIFVPHDSPYWFETSGSENLVMMRIAARVPGAEERVVRLDGQYADGQTYRDKFPRAPLQVREGAFFGG